MRDGRVSGSRGEERRRVYERRDRWEEEKREKTKGKRRIGWIRKSKKKIKPWARVEKDCNKMRARAYIRRHVLMDELLLALKIKTKNDAFFCCCLAVSPIAQARTLEAEREEMLLWRKGIEKRDREKEWEGSGGARRVQMQSFSHPPRDAQKHYLNEKKMGLCSVSKSADS